MIRLMLGRGVRRMLLPVLSAEVVVVSLEKVRAWSNTCCLALLVGNGFSRNTVQLSTSTQICGGCSG